MLNFVFCVQDKQMYMRQDNYYRVSSAHLQNYDQVKEINRETPTNDEIDETKRRQPQSPSRSNKLPMISVHARNANTPARNLAPSRGLSRRKTRVTWVAQLALNYAVPVRDVSETCYFVLYLCSAKATDWRISLPVQFRTWQDQKVRVRFSSTEFITHQLACFRTLRHLSGKR